MNFFDIGRLLYEFEEESLEFYKDKDIDGWNSWVILRRPLYYYIFNNSFKEKDKVAKGFEKSASESKLKKRVGDFIKFQYLLITKLLTKPKKGLVVMFPISSGKIYDKQTRQHVDFLMDPFVQYHILDNYLYLETSIDGKLIRPAAIEPDALVDGLFLPIYTLKAVLRKGNNFKDLSADYETVLNNFFKKKNQDFTLTAEAIRELFINFYAEYSIYKLFFSSLKPELAIFSDELFSGKMAAAAKLCIKTIELQHGLIGKYKPDYYLAGQLNNIRSSIPLCNKLAVFGQFHKDVILSPGFWQPDEVVAIGNYQIEQARETNKDRPDHVFTILFPTQWHVFEESRMLLTKIIPYVVSKNLKLIIKVHPRENETSKEWYESVALEHSSQVQFASKEAGFYDLLQMTDVLVGFDSTTLLEAIALNVPTITVTTPVITKGIHSYLWTDKLENAIKIAESPDMVKDLIEKLNTELGFKSRWKEEISRQGEYLYASSYLEKIKSLISDVQPL